MLRMLRWHICIHLLDFVGVCWNDLIVDTEKKVLGLSATLPNVEDIAKWNPGSRPNHLWQLRTCNMSMRSERNGEL